MRLTRSFRTIFASILAAAAVLPIANVGSPAAVVQAAGLGAGGEYHPLTPSRVFDTRAPGIGIAPGALPSKATGSTVDVQLLGTGGIPANGAEVLAAVVSITVVSPTQAGYLQAYPSGASAGISSVVNFAAGQTVPNLTVATIGANGKLTVRLVTGTPGTAHVFIDVFGWFSTSSSTQPGARLIPVGPGRIFDSREASFNGTGRPLGAGTVVPVTIRGADAQTPSVTDIIPASGNVVGVVLNVTGVNTLVTSRSTYVSVLPETPAANPTTSNLNLVPGQIKANLVIVPVTNANGAIRLFNAVGETHLVVDVVGYMLANQDPNTRRGRVIPLASPFRAFDTREATFGNVQLGPGQAETWSFAQFAATVTLGGQPVGNQAALLGTLTATGLTRLYPTAPVASFLTVYPSDVGRPNSSNVNIAEGVSVPNMAVIKTSAAEEVKVFNSSGYIHYLFDVSAVVLDD